MISPLRCLTRCLAALCAFLLVAPALWAVEGDGDEKEGGECEPLFFSFKYAGKDSKDFIPSWQRKESTAPSAGGVTRTMHYTDPVTKLRVTAEVRDFDDFKYAVEWVLHFTNDGDTDTPIIEDILPLYMDCTLEHPPTLFYARGSDSTPNDFEPLQREIGEFRLESGGGRSSNNNLPYFNLQTDEGGVPGGIIYAIGWTGNWRADFRWDHSKKRVTVSAGMRRTHLVLHPGETIRTPRILIMNWRGDRTEAHNQWRRLLLAHYSPKDLQGKTVVPPVCFGEGGASTLEQHTAQLQELKKQGIVFDLYWVDASWYGNKAGERAPWDRVRGNWWPSPDAFPTGIGALGKAVRGVGANLIQWLEPETADPGSTLLTEHPEWFIQPAPDQVALIRLGDPVALKGITDIVSKHISESGQTWYRQDFNNEPERYWDFADTPDRIGMTEIGHITGLYAFWDALRERHPGLQIDNCSSGGRRLDLEMITRSVALFRSDMACSNFDPIGAQRHTQGIMPWVPLSAGVYGGGPADAATGGPVQIYAARSSYSPAWLFGADRMPLDAAMRRISEEFHEVRPYFVGDFYPLLTYTPIPDTWAAWQLHRPETKDGLILLMRRPASPCPVFELSALQAIDPEATYEVEIRPGLDKTEPKQMSGKALRALRVTLDTQPASALIFYKQQ